MYNPTDTVANYLKFGVIAALLFCLFGLLFLFIGTLRYGKRAFHSRTAGSELKGIWYAFTSGMMPWIKESAKKHLPTYITGVIYHIGIFSAILYLLATLIIPSIIPPNWVLIPGRGLLAASLLGGTGLLVKRLIKPEMKAISVLDDYVSNLTVTCFVGAALFTTFSDRFLVLFYALAMALFIYIPLGKIRHCFFFFTTRVFFGRFFGRRGIFPRKAL